jgi:prevent-host-death family protein
VDARVVSLRELRNDISAVLHEVESGQRMVVTKNGTPVAELRPLRKPPVTADQINELARRYGEDWRKHREDVDAGYASDEFNLWQHGDD